ncbi:MAG: hypothetical protein FWG63_09445 [Defluviitaleaceae bacterium]|nr:hypothetical protein [Defluviitaleaceae bacterium]
MKIFVNFIALAFVALLVACGEEQPTAVEARAIFELDRVYIDGQETPLSEENIYTGSTLTFVGPESGGNVLIRIGGADATIALASINPSREHPSFLAGYWHHHLYSGATVAGSPRINFVELFPNLGIDDDDNLTDNTQSSYQRGNLYYIVQSGEFMLRFTIDGAIHDLIFVENSLQ